MHKHILPLLFLRLSTARPVETRGREEGVSYPGARDVWEAPPLLRNTKYSRMRHFKEKI